MSATLVFNLVLLVAVGALLVWFPDRFMLAPLILSKVTPPGIETNAGPSRRSAPGPDANRRQTKVKKKAQKNRDHTRRNKASGGTKRRRSI